MNTILTFAEALINDSYSIAQWYSRILHDQLMDILHCFGTVILMFWNDLTTWGATAAIATWQWLMNTFNSCDMDFIPVPPLSTDPGFITYSVIASDLMCDWQRLSTPVKEGVSRMTAAIGIAMAVVRELL